MQDITSSRIIATRVKNCLIVTIGEDLSIQTLKNLQRLVLSGIHEKGCSSIVFELSALKYMDLMGLKKFLKWRLSWGPNHYL